MPAISLLIGLTNGLLITKVKLAAFCGHPVRIAVLSRSDARNCSGSNPRIQGWIQRHCGNSRKASSICRERDFGIPNPCLILIVVTILAIIFLNFTIYGRYMLALGRNETAARFSGINTDRMIILAYVICGMLSGLGGLLFVLDVGSAQPVDFGNFYELYAIAGAVLGGCSLRGGEGTILGVVIGAAVMQVLKNTITLVDAIPTNIEYAVIGAVILGGVIVDELVKRYAARRRAAQQARLDS